jgi:hypothetical protein
MSFIREGNLGVLGVCLKELQMGKLWVQAVIRHHPLTRCFRVEVKQIGDLLILDGQVPTVQDRKTVGSIAAAAVSSGVVVKNCIMVSPDITLRIKNPGSRQQVRFTNQFVPARAVA